MAPQWMVGIMVSLLKQLEAKVGNICPFWARALTPHNKLFIFSMETVDFQEGCSSALDS